MATTLDPPVVLNPSLPCTCHRTHKPAWRIFALSYNKSSNGTQSYRLAYPNASYESANSEASRLLVMPCIQWEMARLRQVFERESVLDHERELVWNSEQAKDDKDLSAHREAVMAHARIIGKLIERRADVTLSEDDQSKITQFVQQMRARHQPPLQTNGHRRQVDPSTPPLP